MYKSKGNLHIIYNSHIRDDTCIIIIIYVITLEKGTLLNNVEVIINLALIKVCSCIISVNNNR